MRFSRILLAAVMPLTLSSAIAQDSDAAADPAVEPGAIAAMDRMSAALRSHGDFAVTANVTNEDVMDDGQKLQYVGTLDIRAHRPDRFKISVASDIQNRDIYYNGKTVTVFSPRLGMYASFSAPGTIAQTIDLAQKRYGVELPLADLFAWGADKSLAARLTSGFLVRPEKIDGRTCDHYAFRQKSVDWQIWIAQDASATPCKLVITTTTDSSMPQYTAVMHWSFPATIADSNFAFAPPSGAQKIAIAELQAGK